MEPPQAPAKQPVRPQAAAIPFRVITPDLKKILLEGAHKTVILNAGQAKKVAESITLAIQRAHANTPNKLLMLFVHKGDEAFAPALADPASKEYRAFGQMAIALAANRFSASGPEKGNPLATSQPKAPESEIELISYAYNDQEEKEAAKLLDLFIHSLETLNENKNLKIVIVAEGESAYITNLMSSQKGRKQIDTLIYLQSPIYEWAWNVTYYTYHDDYAPKNFRNLYNIYTKIALPKSGAFMGLRYPERKYKQQARVENGQLISPIKNIRAIKVGENRSLENITLEDFFSEHAIQNYVPLFEQADTYQVNSDLITKLFDQTQAPPSVAVNHFVRQNGNMLQQSMGISIIGKEYFYDVIDIPSLSQRDLRRTFSQEVDKSLGQLINITQLPILEEWSIPTTLEEWPHVLKLFLGGLSGDIDRIKKQHVTVLSSPLFAFKPPSQAEQFSFIITNRVRSELATIALDTGLSEAFVEGKMKSGAYYMSLLLTAQNELIPTRDQEEYLHAIIAIIWFFYSQAIENKQTFKEGTFVIEDRGWQLNTFLMKYVKTYGDPIRGIKKPMLINQPFTGTIDDPALNMSYNGFAYPRESSHFEVSQESFRHYGIDIRFGGSGELPLLPADKRHLLFGKIDEQKQLLFIKPENYGLYYKDGFIYHGKEYIESIARKFGYSKTSNDDPSYAKERVPTEFLKELKKALDQSNLPEDEKERILIKANQDNWGMKILYSGALLTNPAINDLEKKYGSLYNHLPLRTGREVILTHQDLQRVLRIGQPQGAQQNLAAVPV